MFRGTRVPLRNLFDYLMRGGTVEEFLVDFPAVSFEQVRPILRAAEVAVEAQAA